MQALSGRIFARAQRVECGQDRDALALITLIIIVQKMIYFSRDNSRRAFFKSSRWASTLSLADLSAGSA
jgi:hypothetical protein